MKEEIDEEIVVLIEKLNKFDFLETEFSCSGHDNMDPYISFKVHDVEKFFNFIIEVTDHLNNYGREKKWNHQEALFESGANKYRVAIHFDNTRIGKNRDFNEIIELWKEFEKFVDGYVKY